VSNPLIAGTGLALLAALAFGVTTPWLQRLGVGLGPFATAALLYLGAALGAVPLPRRNRGGDSRAGAPQEPAVTRRHLPRLALVALFGAALAPSLFAWGLQRIGPALGSLLLNAEAVFTVALAALIHREHVGGRVAIAAGLMFLGGVATVATASASGSAGLWGALAVLGAVASWAVDNVLTRPFADLDPAGVVRVKAVGGALLTSLLAIGWREPLPELGQALGLITCGATGYGLSIRLYLLAQRRIGAARTGSVFATAPFVGLVASLAIGEQWPGGVLWVAAALFGLGVALHLTESHGHEHWHEPMAHEHAHTHGDGHHDHLHEVAPDGAHSHPHRHEVRVHSHPHGPDVHHGHSH
jgi:drug/metabolite transporter (DMT)-like permease